MATSHDWEEYLFAIDYTRTSYEAHVPLVDILRFLRWNGYPTLTLATVEGWVHAYQSTEDSPPPTSTRRTVQGLPAPANNQTGHPEPNSSSSVGGTTAGVTSAETTSSNYSSNLHAPANNQTTSHQPITGANSTMPQNLPPASWDAQADRFAMSAHLVGTSIATITAQLNNNGYDNASMDDVINSLTRQGAKTLNFTPR